MLSQLPADPRVSCMIVCSGYMRASGFFFETARRQYLVTARHSALPTNMQVLNPTTGGTAWATITEDFLPDIDIYLRQDSAFSVEQIDLRERNEVITIEELDLLAVPLHFDPKAFGYRVFSGEDVRSGLKEQDTLFVFGFCNDSFPQTEGEYDIDHYKNSIGEPYQLSLENSIGKSGKDPWSGNYGKCVDRAASSRDDYNGLSGAPLLGDGLVGLHLGTSEIPDQYIEQGWLESGSKIVHYLGMQVIMEIIQGGETAPWRQSSR